MSQTNCIIYKHLSRQSEGTGFESEWEVKKKGYSRRETDDLFWPFFKYNSSSYINNSFCCGMACRAR